MLTVAQHVCWVLSYEDTTVMKYRTKAANLVIRTGYLMSRTRVLLIPAGSANAMREP
jgi:hypothetical protein